MIFTRLHNDLLTWTSILKKFPVKVMAARVLRSISGICQRRSEPSGLGSQQRRWFDWDPNVTKRDGKPAITGSKHAYVAAKIPVVLLRDVDGLGPKGAVVEVKRGYARNVLVPGGHACYGTLWENIDAHADPNVATKQKIETAKLANRVSFPFDWLNSVKLEFVRDKVASSSKLTDPIVLSEVLTALSVQEQVDFLPSQLSFPAEGIQTIGKHLIGITLDLKLGTFEYTIKIDVKDKLEIAAAERREEELREAMKISRPEFVLGSSRLSGPSKLESEERADDGDEEEQ